MLQHRCPCIVTRLGPPILLVTGIPYVRAPLTQLCLQFWLLGEPSSPGPGPMAREWQSPWGSSPYPALSLSYPHPCPHPSLPCPRAGIAQDAVYHWTSGPQSFYFPPPLAFPHKAGGVKAGRVAQLLGQDCLFKPVGMGHRQPESCWVRGRTSVPGWERFLLVAESGWRSHWNL